MKSKDHGEAEVLGSDVARSDWDRYGSHAKDSPPAQIPADSDDAASTDAPARAAGLFGRGNTGTAAPRTPESDQLYVEYRYENGFSASNEEETPRNRRVSANVAVVAAVGIALIIGAGYGLLTSGPAPTPLPRLSVSPIVDSSPSGSGLIAQTPLLAHIGVAAELPLDAVIADRDQQPDDGTIMYLTGASGGLSIDPLSGRVLKVYGGPAFSVGQHRAIVRDGLWVAVWPKGAQTCGPSCWHDSQTYRIDIATGAVTKALQGTYLLGADSGGVWVATAGKLELLDPTTAAVTSTTPWTGDAEPRLGCGSLWSYEPAQDGATVTQVAPETGAPLGKSKLPPLVTYGPSSIAGRCWMMTGADGVSAGSATLVWLSPDGTTFATSTYPRSILSLNREFWTYTDTTLQRFEPSSGTNYGASYTLIQQPPNNDPRWLFSAANTLWMLNGRSLTGFDMPTGASSARLPS